MIAYNASMRSLVLAGLVVALSARAVAQDRAADARAAAACLTHYAHGPDQLERVPPDGMAAALGGEGHYVLRCMPASFGDLEVPTAEGAPLVAACLSRLASAGHTAGAALLREACVERAQSVALEEVGRIDSVAPPRRVATGIGIAIPYDDQERVNVGMWQVANAVGARTTELTACRALGRGVVIVYVRAGIDGGDAVTLERSAGASDALGQCVQRAAAVARLRPGQYTHPGDRIRALVAVTFDDVAETPDAGTVFLLGALSDRQDGVAGVLSGGNAGDVLAGVQGVAPAPNVVRVADANGSSLLMAPVSAALEPRAGRIATCLAHVHGQMRLRVTVSGGIARHVDATTHGDAAECLAGAVTGTTGWPSATPVDVTLAAP